MNMLQNFSRPIIRLPHYTIYASDLLYISTTPLTLTFHLRSMMDRSGGIALLEVYETFEERDAERTRIEKIMSDDPSNGLSVVHDL